MTYEIVNGSALGQKFKNVSLARDAQINLAIAFIGRDAVALLGEENLSQTRIVCDYTSGGTNPIAVDALIAGGAKVKHLEGLHAKIGTVDDAFSFVGSSNLSTHGMIDEQRHERVVIFNGAEPKIAGDWEVFWGKSVIITDEMKTIALRAWRLRQHYNATKALSGAPSNLIENLLTSPETLKALGVHMVVYEQVVALKKFKEGENAVKMQNSKSFEAYWDLKGLPHRGYLVDFARSAKGKLRFTGLYRRDTSETIDAQTDDGSFAGVVRVKSICGITCTSEDQTKLADAFEKYRIGKPADEDGNWCFCIASLREYLKDDQ